MGGNQRERLLAYCGGGQHGVQGWLQDDALLLTLLLHGQQRAAGFGGGVAEIGVHHGRYFIALALMGDGPGERALAVDVFEDQHLNPDGSGHGDRAAFEANLAAWGLAGRPVVLQRDSLTLTPEAVRALVGPPGVRLFSVDGSHTLGHAAHDLRLAAACLAPGGVVMLDDFFHRDWPGVTEAAVLLLHGENPPLAPLAICGGKLALVAAAEHAAWLARLRAAVLPLAQHAQRVLLGGWECWSLSLRQGDAAWALAGDRPLAALHLAGPAPQGGRLGDGWSVPEDWGRWTVAEVAEFTIALPPPAAMADDTPRPRRLALHLGTLLADPKAGRHVVVSVAGTALAPPLHLAGEAMQWHVVDLPPLPDGLAELPVTLRCEGGLNSPAALGRGADERRLGVNLTSALLLP
jgi:hypothetical protein